MNGRNLDLIVVGHFSLDSISLPTSKTPLIALGGAVTYVSLVSRLLGANPGIISKIGKDFPEEYLKHLKDEGVDLSGVKKVANGVSTSFSLEYDRSLQNRKLRLVNEAPPLTVNDLPTSLNTKIIHVAPIAGEIQSDLVHQLRKATEILSLDPQGLLRSFDKEGYVHVGLPLDKQLLSVINIYKSSRDEISIATGQTDLSKSIMAIHKIGVKVVIVTHGASGLTISFEGHMHRIPAYPSRKINDPTGAGDAFIGAFLAEHLREEDLLWCACVGSAAASIVVESAGSTFLGNKQEIYKRARVVYEKEIKQ
jgi:sugar/nucleoside kinase (ribokinase family)